MIQVKHENEPRITQGDIYKNVEFIEHITEENGNVEVSKVVFPYVVVLTQDCDLAQDFTFRWSDPPKKNHDKWLFSVLVAPLYNLEQLYNGQHLSELQMTMASISRSKTPGKNLVQNETPRYHYLNFPDDVAIVPSVVDFKHYFSVNVVQLKQQKSEKFVCQIAELYREHLSHRFSSYLSRIGLP
ncbi:hypothetical protein [Shewanella sp. MBTL60-007]|uniref:hypothetical protein n=1 Tax=Shewanella sp. MBTL60-007 TaxID=2815911 RepID=UPI001BC0E4B4|nr:hypothetical protein [Shewanella sp. MBTL60-007]GIU30697.1 hypothetical protein TUM3792_41730 [Shewanella sp. MBTL60-007]